MTEFYAGKNVVVLGGGGFVGRHLCKQLLGLKANVVVIDNLARSYSWPAAELGGAILRRVDIIKASGTLRAELEWAEPFAVFNLAAAVAGVEYNQNNHNQMFLDNVNLQFVPVQVCDELQVPHYLQVSSVCIYGEDANAPAVEYFAGDRLTAANLGYSWSKRMGENAVRWSNLPHAVIVRPSNIYGPGDWYDDKAHVIPKLIKRVDEGQARRFSPSPTREFLYVTDAAEGMLHALELGAHKGVYNLGTGGDTISIDDLLKYLCTLMDKSVPTEIEDAPFDQGDKIRYSSAKKIHRLGWKHKVGLDEGLKLTLVDYYTRVKGAKTAYASPRCHQ